MSASIITQATAAAVSRLTQGAGSALNGQGATSSGAPAGFLGAEHFVRQHAPLEYADSAALSRNPVFFVYCDRLVTAKREKFATFTATLHLVIELHTSSTKVGLLEVQTEAMVDAIRGILESAGGDWGGGLFYSGGYEVQFGPAKKGGQGFLQTARLLFQLDCRRP